MRRVDLNTRAAPMIEKLLAIDGRKRSGSFLRIRGVSCPFLDGNPVLVHLRLEMKNDPASDELIGWLGRYILPHEARLRAWLRAAFATVDIDDVVQESYCRIAALERVDHIDDPRQYLFRTARNVVLEQIRRSKVVRIETVSGLAELEKVMPDDVISPERVLAGRRMLERVEQLISALPERGRRVFRLRKIDGLSQREIATQLGISETIVENELTRGLRRIIQSMTDEERAEMPVRRSRGRKHDQRTSNQDR